MLKFFFFNLLFFDFSYQAQRTNLWWELPELDPVSWPCSSKVPPSVPSVVARSTKAMSSATRPSPQANTSLPLNMVTSTLPAVHTNRMSQVRTTNIWSKWMPLWKPYLLIKSLSFLSTINPNNYHNCYILYTFFLVCLLNFTLYIFILYTETY